MKKTFQVENVKCSGCANTLRKTLENDFGEVEVDLTKTPREITLEISEDQIETLRLKLRNVGYPLSDDNLSTLENVGAKAKSFVSCAIGKMN